MESWQQWTRRGTLDPFWEDWVRKRGVLQQLQRLPERRLVLARKEAEFYLTEALVSAQRAKTPETYEVCSAHLVDRLGDLYLADGEVHGGGCPEGSPLAERADLVSSVLEWGNGTWAKAWMAKNLAVEEAGGKDGQATPPPEATPPVEQMNPLGDFGALPPDVSGAFRSYGECWRPEGGPSCQVLAAAASGSEMCRAKGCGCKWHLRTLEASLGTFRREVLEAPEALRNALITERILPQLWEVLKSSPAHQWPAPRWPEAFSCSEEKGSPLCGCWTRFLGSSP